MDMVSGAEWSRTIPRKIVRPHFIFQFKEETMNFRLRLIVTRQMRRAVDRNRVKRVVREFFRQNRSFFPEHLLVCRIHPSAAKVKNALLFQELDKIWTPFKRLQKDFRVAGRAQSEVVTMLRSEFARVIDLAVENDRSATALANHRLIRARVEIANR